MRPPKPNAAQRAAHGNYALTDRQAKRMLAGVTESHPSDYAYVASEDALRQRDARRAVEDRRIARELGIEEKK